MTARALALIGFLLLGVVSMNTGLFAWDDKTTHPDLSAIVSQNSILGKDSAEYLKDLGFPGGLSQRIKWGNAEQSVQAWIQEGARLEDEGGDYAIVTGQARSYNHFHNALKSHPWHDAGLDDWFLIHVGGESSLAWAQDKENQASSVGGDWSWETIKYYYYLALTEKTDLQRQACFAKTFRGLGHQMHLIQDAAVPDHARNDAHPEDSKEWGYGIGFEKWASNNSSFIKSLATPPTLPDLDLATPISGYSPIARFLDTDQYRFEDPSGFFTDNLAVSRRIGLAEYTNANFFSDDTIFTENYPENHRHKFPYPRKSSTDLQEYIERLKRPETIIAEDGNEDSSIYIKKVGDGEEIEHFLRPMYLGSLLLDGVGEVPLYYRLFYRDRKCHEDYAEKLIPRVVGYSIGLVDYFFRGSLDMERIGGTNTEMEISIRNRSNESLSNGVFKLYYDNDQGNRTEIELSRSYVISMAPDESYETEFKIPSDFGTGKKGRYMLVYLGKVGEEGAVIGRYKVLPDYRGCMVVYHKHMRRLFFMSHDQDGNEKNFYIDLGNLVVPLLDTTHWSSADWSYWFWVRHNPLGLSVLEYDGKIGILIYSDWEQGYFIKFKVTTPAEGYLDFNIGGEIMGEYLYGNAYGEATSYGNGSYGLGTKRFYKYNFDYLKQKIYGGSEYGHINQGRLVLWEENPGSGDLSTLQWDFTYSVSSNTGSWIFNNSLCWVTSSSPIPWKSMCLASFLESPWNPQGWSLVGGMVTALNNDFKGVGFRWWDWIEYKGETWADGPQYRHMYTHPNDPYNYARVNPPPPVVIDGGNYVGREPLPTGRLPHGGTVSRMMGAFRKPGTTDEITEYYRINDKFYFGGLDTIPSNLMDPQTYPFGPAIKELPIARNWLGLDHVPAVQIEEQNNFIGNSTWPMIWHTYLLKGSMKLKNGKTETVYGLVSSRQTEFFDSWSTMERTWWDADGPLGDIRTLCDFGLIDVNSF